MPPSMSPLAFSYHNLIWYKKQNPLESLKNFLRSLHQGRVHLDSENSAHFKDLRCRYPNSQHSFEAGVNDFAPDTPTSLSISAWPPSPWLWTLDRILELSSMSSHNLLAEKNLPSWKHQGIPFAHDWIWGSEQSSLPLNMEFFAWTWPITCIWDCLSLTVHLQDPSFHPPQLTPLSALSNLITQLYPAHWSPTKMYEVFHNWHFCINLNLCTYCFPQGLYSSSTGKILHLCLCVIVVFSIFAKPKYSSFISNF